MEHNALSGLLLYNETLNENKMISTYSSQRAEALISSGPVPTWTNAHTYSVRKEVPFVSSVSASTPPTSNKLYRYYTPCRYWFSSEIYLDNRSTGDIVTLVTD